MSLRRFTVMVACAVAVCAMTSTAYAGSPRWYGKETGALVPYGGNAGLVELATPETVHGVGHLKLLTKSQSVCLVRSQESIENPMNALAPGTGAMEEFEIVCEEGTGPGPNEAEPFPCTNGEAFEVKAVNLSWPSVLEVGEARRTTKATERAQASKHAKGNGHRHLGTRARHVAHPATIIRNLPRYYDNFTKVNVELDCLKSHKQMEYSGSLRPEVEVGRLSFLGSESGELEDSAGHRFSLSGGDFFVSTKYKDVRVNSEYQERPVISSLMPSSGAASGGTEVTVHGRGFAAGSETSFDFGKIAGTAVNCATTTECSVVTPAHAVGKVTVSAVVRKLSSKASPSDVFTYR